MYRKFFKRFLDVVLSLTAIIVLSPLMIISYILTLVFLGKPAIFRQERVGKNEKLFTIYKFRTMTDKRDENGELLPDECRHTGFGDFLRKTSMDELPQLFNILKGDMSIVGPRPLPEKYIPYYTETERKRHNVRGGLTQPEVLYGYLNPTWEQQLGCEVEYADNISFLLDVKIIFATVIILFRRVKSKYGDDNEFRPPLDIERKKENR